jgi:hypothetical protein
MVNLLQIQDKLGEDFKSKRARRASKATIGKVGNGMDPSPGKPGEFPPKYQLKENDDDKQVRWRNPPVKSSMVDVKKLKDLKK